MFKSRSQNGSDSQTGRCPAGLTKATVPTAPPGLSLPPSREGGSRPPSPVPYTLQPDETNLEKKDSHGSPGNSKVTKEPSHQLLRRVKLLNPEDLKAGQVAPWLALAESLSRSNDPESAANLLTKVAQEGFTSEITTNHYSVIVTAFARKGNAAKAEHWLNLMLENKCRATAVCFGSVIDAFAKQGNVPSAEMWLERMLKTDVQANVISYTAVVEACAKVGDIAKAEAWLTRMTTA